MDPEEIGTGGRVDYDLALATFNGSASGLQPSWLESIHDYVWDEEEV